MTKFTREYYPISKAAELLGCEPDDLLHKGAQGSFDIYVMAKNWSGKIFDHTYLHTTTGGLRFYNGPRDREQLNHLVKLPPETVRLFEDGTEEVTVKWVMHSPNPETGQERHIELDAPIVIKKTQLFVKTEDIQSLLFASPPQEADEDENITPYSNTSTETENELTVGLDKHAIATAFDRIHWGRDQWINNLGDCPKWLEPARSTLGKRGKRGDAFWNPVAIAIQLHDKHSIQVSILSKAFREKPILLPWLEEWKEAKDNFSD